MLAILLFVCAALLVVRASVLLSMPTLAEEAGRAQRIWVIDAGHGGEDGGAVAADGTKESDLNLAVAQRLSALFLLLGEDTRMTRTADISIHSAEASTLRQKKRSDLENRVSLVNKTPGAVLVSIHQNSLPSSRAVHGAQVFYGSWEGSALLAQCVQSVLNAQLNLGNEKSDKQIDNTIYLMKNAAAPAILVECGFLSNASETALLRDASYQTKLALCVAEGLLIADIKSQ